MSTVRSVRRLQCACQDIRLNGDWSRHAGASAFTLSGGGGSGREGQLVRKQWLWNQETLLSALPSTPPGILRGVCPLPHLPCNCSAQACLTPGPQLSSSPRHLAMDLFSSPYLWQRKLSAVRLSAGPEWAPVVTGFPEQQSCPASSGVSVAAFLRHGPSHAHCCLSALNLPGWSFPEPTTAAPDLVV